MQSSITASQRTTRLTTRSGRRTRITRNATPAALPVAIRAITSQGLACASPITQSLPARWTATPCSRKRSAMASEPAEKKMPWIGSDTSVTPPGPTSCGRWRAQQRPVDLDIAAAAGAALDQSRQQKPRPAPFQHRAVGVAALRLGSPRKIDWRAFTMSHSGCGTMRSAGSSRITQCSGGLSRETRRPFVRCRARCSGCRCRVWGCR